MPPLVVVAAAIVTGDPPRLLAARRAAPRAHAGWWELPGGKVEPGEAEPEALRRELREELGVDAVAGGRAAADVSTVDGTAVLRTYWARVVGGELVAREHDALRWLAVHELDDVKWLPSDVPVLDELRAAGLRPHNLRP